jgi:hypothetical protein
MRGPTAATGRHKQRKAVLPFTHLSNAFLALELLHARAFRQFVVSYQTQCNEWTRSILLIVCLAHTECCNFHSKKDDLSYFIRPGVIADQCHRAKERGCVLRVCSRPAPFCNNLQSLCNRAGPFLFGCQSRPTRVSKERPRLKAFCRVAFSVRLKLRAMLAARVFLPASRFNVRMSRLLHARLFIDLLRGFNEKKLSAVPQTLKSRGRCRFDLNHIRALFPCEQTDYVGPQTQSFGPHAVN